MAEQRNEAFSFTVKADVWEHAKKLADESKTGNVKVYLTKEIMKYAGRMRKDRVRADKPIPNKLNSHTKENVLVTLMLTEEELEKAQALMKYQWFFKNDKFQCSLFMSCLIEHNWYKFHPEEKIVKDPIEAEKPIHRPYINLEGDHDGEDWSGEG